MFNKQSKQGFTLIELLVVVLIIGILASIALPQYKAAVARSRVSAMLPLVSSIAQAQNRYFLENDQYTSKVADLDIEVPSSCAHVNYSAYNNNDKGELLACGTDFAIDNMKNNRAVTLNYCPGGASTAGWDSCKNARILRVDFHFSHHTEEPNKRYCSVFKSDKLAKRICAGLPEFTTRDQ